MASREQNRDNRARRLIAEGKCLPLTVVPGKVWLGVIIGDSGRYTVFSVSEDAMAQVPVPTGLVPPRWGCQCESFKYNEVCAHVHAATILRVQSTPMDELWAQVGA